MLTKLLCVDITKLFSPCSITIGSESGLKVEKLLRSLHMSWDTPESMTHFVPVEATTRANAVSQKGLQSPVVPRAAVAIALFPLHHSLICL
jgi:hypothetical protein